MRRVTFSADDLTAIAWERYHHPEPRVQRKMEILWLKHHGQTHADIARLAGVARSTVQRTLDEFLAGGLEGIRRCPWVSPGSALEQHRLSLEEHFRAHHQMACLGSPFANCLQCPRLSRSPSLAPRQAIYPIRAQ